MFKKLLTIVPCVSVRTSHFPAGFDLQRQTVVRHHNLAVEPDEMELHEV